MFLVVAKKSRTLSSFSYSANEQVCRSWEGARPDSQPRLAKGNIPYHGRHAEFVNGRWLGAGILFYSLFFCEFSHFSMSLASSAKFVSWAKSVKFMSSGKPEGSAIAAWGLTANQSSGGEKTVLCAVCFAYSLLLLVVVVFSCVLLNCLYLSPEVLLLSVLLPIPLRGKGRGERAAVWCLVASCWVKP